MFFKKIPWKDRDYMNMSNMLSSFNMESFFNDIAKRQISSFSLDLLKRMIVIEEEDRISWDELFDLVLDKVEKPNCSPYPNLEDSNDLS